MFKINLRKNKENKLKLILEGGIEIDSSSIKSYEDYHREEVQRLIKGEVRAYLNSILPNPYNCGSSLSAYIYSSNYRHGYNEALDDLTLFLTKNYENTSN